MECSNSFRCVTSYSLFVWEPLSVGGLFLNGREISLVFNKALLGTDLLLDEAAEVDFSSKLI